MRSDGRADGGRATAGDVDRIAPLFDAYRQFYGATPDLAAARRFLADRLAANESVVLLAVAEAPHRKAAPSGPGDPHCGEAEGFVADTEFTHLSLAIDPAGAAPAREYGD